MFIGIGLPIPRLGAGSSWFANSNLHIKYKEDSIINQGVGGTVSDVNTNTSASNLSSANGLHVPAASVNAVAFSDLSWLDSDDYTIIMKVQSDATGSNRRILGFSGSGRGLQTDGPTSAKFHSGTTITVDNSIGTARFDDADGAWVAISGDQYGRSVVFGDRGLVNTSDLSLSMTALYVAERNTGGNELDGYVHEFIHIPYRVTDNALRLITNPDHDITTTADLVADSSESARVGNTYHTLGSIESSSRLANDIQIGLEAGSSFSEDSLDVSSVTGAKLIKVGSGNDPVVYGRKLQASWTLTTDQTNTYQASVDMTDWPEKGTAQHLTAFESTAAASALALTDTPLTEQTSIANVEANAGSYYVDYTNSLVYIHPSDSGNPNSNGFAYSYTDGDRKILTDFFSVVGPITVDNIPTDDGLIVEEDGLIENVTVQHCHTHGIFVRPNGVCKDVTVKNTLNVGQGVSPFVANASTAGGTFEFNGCEVVQDSSFDRANCGGFFSHKSGSIASYLSGTVSNSKVTHSESSGGCVEFADTSINYIRSNEFFNCNRCIKVADDTTQAEITENFAHGASASGQNIQRFIWTGAVTSPTVDILGNVVYHYGNSGGLIYITHPGTYNIQYNTLVGASGSGNPLAIRISNSEAIVNIRNSIFSDQVWNIYVDGDYGDNITMTNCVFYNSTNNFHYNGTNRSLSQFEALISSASNNTEANPTFTNTPSGWTQLSSAVATATAVSDRSAGYAYYSA